MGKMSSFWSLFTFFACNAPFLWVIVLYFHQRVTRIPSVTHQTRQYVIKKFKLLVGEMQLITVSELKVI